MKKSPLKELRGTDRGSAKKTAETAGIHRSTLARIETGKVKRPREASIRKIAAALQTDPEKVKDFFRKEGAGETQMILKMENLIPGCHTLEGDVLCRWLQHRQLTPDLEKNLHDLAAESLK